MRIPSAFLVPLAATLAALPAASQAAWIVDDDGGPGVDFDDLQIAIDQAGEGDLLLLRPGSYSGPLDPTCGLCLRIEGKSLTLAADPDAGAASLFSIIVSDIAPGQTVVLRGLEIGTYLAAQDDAGTLWIEDCRFPAGAQPVFVDAVRLSVVESRAVHLLRCTVLGYAGLEFSGNPGSSALAAEDSSLHVYDSSFVGGQSAVAGGPSGDGVRLSGSFLFASASHFEGETALHLEADPSLAYTLESTMRGPTPVGIDAGSHAALTGTARHLEVGGPVNVGNVATLHLEGEELDFPILEFALKPGASFDPFLKGTYQLGNPKLLSLVLGPLPPSGELDLALAIQSLGPSIQGLTLYVQAVFFSLPAELTAGPGTALVLADL